MPLLLLFLLVGVFVYLWINRRGSTLTRDCRWREDRSAGDAGHFTCVFCGAKVTLLKGKTPRACLRKLSENASP
jgi:hypothetical protein